MNDALRTQFLDGMSHAASTVSVVTTDGAAGRAGVTVSAMCSVSADPPSLLVCVHHMSQAAQVILDNGSFCVNVLRDEQSWISDVFGGRRPPPEGEDRFSCAEWQTSDCGAPALADALVVFDCELQKSDRFGSHFVFIGHITGIKSNRHGSPLIYANRAYGIARELPVNRIHNSTNSDNANHVLRVGSFATLGSFLTPRIMSEYFMNADPVEVFMLEGDEADVIEGLRSEKLDIGFIYDGIDYQGIESTFLFQAEPYVLLPAQHALCAENTASLHELIKHPMVLLDIPASRNYFVSLFEENGLSPWIAHRAPSFETVRAMVANGFGYSILVTKPANNMSYDGTSLDIRPIREKVTPGRITLARRAEAESSGPAGDFFKFCQNYFSHA